MVAVVGIGHTPGIVSRWNEQQDISQLIRIPERSFASKVRVGDFIYPQFQTSNKIFYISHFRQSVSRSEQPSGVGSAIFSTEAAPELLGALSIKIGLYKIHNHSILPSKLLGPLLF